MADPDEFKDMEGDALLRQIAATSKTTANWVSFIGLVVLVQVVLVLLVVFGAITLETTNGF